MPPDNLKIALAGCYTDAHLAGIYRLELAPETGECRAVPLELPLENPSYMVFSKKKGRVYLVSETKTFQGQAGGAVACCRWNGSGLHLSSIQPTLGIDPCHLILDDKEACVLAANYGTGTCAVFPLDEQGELQPCSQLIRHRGRGKNPLRQEGPHVHCVRQHPADGRIALCDLGLDKISLYAGQGGVVSDAPLQEVLLPEESGPRHLIWRSDGQYAYVANELANTVVVLQEENHRLQPVQVVSTLPPDFQGESTCAAIKFSPDERFLYVSNRGHDSICCFQLEGLGRLRLVEIVPSWGRTPRDLALDDSGCYLLAANQESDRISIFSRDLATGKLTFTGCQAELRRPVCICFINC